MSLRTAMKIFIPAVGVVALVLLLFGIPGKFFVQKHPLICEGSTCDAMNKYLMPVFDKMRKDAQLEINTGEATDISLYFRDLRTGAWYGINKDEKFNLASLTKVPFMMECLESVESNPDKLKKRLRFSGDNDWTLQQNIKPKTSLEPGKTYSFDEMMFRMIAYSDNNALSLLLN